MHKDNRVQRKRHLAGLSEPAVVCLVKQRGTRKLPKRGNPMPQTGDMGRRFYVRVFAAWI
jgi:hypothetical protein